MSALILHPVAAKGYRCDIDDCNRVGTKIVHIASHPVRSPHKSGPDQRFRLCARHAREWRSIWNEMAGADELETAA